MGRENMSIDIDSLGPDQKLWYVVITRALKDLYLPKSSRDSTDRWFSMHNDAYVFVCENAGLDPENLLQILAKDGYQQRKGKERIFIRLEGRLL